MISSHSNHSLKTHIYRLAEEHTANAHAQTPETPNTQAVRYEMPKKRTTQCKLIRSLSVSLLQHGVQILQNFLRFLDQLLPPRSCIRVTLRLDTVQLQ